MKSKTSLVAQQTRLNEWAQQIRDCQSRPHGMTIEDWCNQHNLKKASYYWRLRKVREALLEVTDISPSFVELPAPETESISTVEPKISAVLKGTNQFTLEITEQASPIFLKTLLGAMLHAQ